MITGTVNKRSIAGPLGQGVGAIDISVKGTKYTSVTPGTVNKRSVQLTSWLR